MKKNNLNKNTLSKACEIPYTTIDGWYKKGYEGLKLTTLKKLSNYFGTSLDFWANDNVKVTETSLSNELFAGEKDEIELLNDYRILNENTKSLVRGITKGMAISEKIANRKGETVNLLMTENANDEFVKNYENLDPEYQDAILEVAKQMITNNTEK